VGTLVGEEGIEPPIVRRRRVYSPTALSNSALSRGGGGLAPAALMDAYAIVNVFRCSTGPFGVLASGAAGLVNRSVFARPAGIEPAAPRVGAEGDAIQRLDRKGVFGAFACSAVSGSPRSTAPRALPGRIEVDGP